MIACDGWNVVSNIWVGGFACVYKLHFSSSTYRILGCSVLHGIIYNSDNLILVYSVDGFIGAVDES